jgi:hypothetical protein
MLVRGQRALLGLLGGRPRGQPTVSVTRHSI